MERFSDFCKWPMSIGEVVHISEVCSGCGTTQKGLCDQLWRPFHGHGAATTANRDMAPRHRRKLRIEEISRA